MWKPTDDGEDSDGEVGWSRDAAMESGRVGLYSLGNTQPHSYLGTARCTLFRDNPGSSQSDARTLDLGRRSIRILEGSADDVMDARCKKSPGFHANPRVYPAGIPVGSGITRLDPPRVQSDWWDATVSVRAGLRERYYQDSRTSIQRAWRRPRRRVPTVGPIHYYYTNGGQLL